MSTGILGWLFGKDPNKAFNKGVEKVANHHSHKSFGQLFEEATEELGNLQAGLAKAITPFSVSLPAAKYLDLGIGVDLHSTVAPPSPMMPVPNTIMVFDIIGAIFGGIAMLVPDPPPPPPPAEGEEPVPSPITLASVGRTIVDMMRPTVKVNGRWIANAGTSIQHLPAIFFHLAPSVAPMAEGEVYMGSSTVVADGAPFTYQYNAYGNRTAMESSLGAKLQHTYNEWGECVRTEVNQQAQTQAQATTPIALWQASYGYNRMGWEVARFLQGDVVQHTDYDLAGRVVVQRTDKAQVVVVMSLAGGNTYGTPLTSLRLLSTMANTQVLIMMQWEILPLPPITKQRRFIKFLMQ
nr:PAAR domain-containing protein [uncultured Capnocytophaga sp.]